MATQRKRYGTLGVVAVAVAAAVAVAGCGASGSSTAGKQPVTGKTPVSSSSTPYTVEATYTSAALGLDHPQALAVGPDGNLYVTDHGQHVTVVSPSGHLVRRWGGQGHGPGKFHFVSPDASDPIAVHASLAVDHNGLVYVSDSGNGRVEVFSPRGKYLRQFGRFGSGKADFLDPFDIATDGRGGVYVADDKLETLSKWTTGGAFSWRIGGTYTSDADLMGHFHLSSVDRHGRLVTVIDDVARIVLIDRAGHKLDAFGGPDQLGDDACGASVDAKGYIYTAGCGSHGGAIIDSSHHLVTRWPASAALSLFTPPQFVSATEAYALTSDGSIVKLRLTAAGA